MIFIANDLYIILLHVIRCNCILCRKLFRSVQIFIHDNANICILYETVQNFINIITRYNYENVCGIQDIYCSKTLVYSMNSHFKLKINVNYISIDIEVYWYNKSWLFEFCFKWSYIKILGLNNNARKLLSSSIIVQNFKNLGL